jgi:hypothetical protein
MITPSSATTARPARRVSVSPQGLICIYTTLIIFSGELGQSDAENDISARSTVILRPSDAYDLEQVFFGDEPAPNSRRSSQRRRKSTDSSPSPMSARLGERFPSLTRRWKHRKQDSKLAESGLQISTSSRPPSTRSSSFTSSMFQTFDQTEASPKSRKLSGGEASIPTSPIEITRADLDEPFDREKLASTPLLPPMMTAIHHEDVPAASPLQSPTIAESGASFSSPNSPLGTPQLRGLSSPPLSSKPSISSFTRARAGTLPTSTSSPIDISTLILANPNDKWAQKLGHANFNIEPEPYLPEICNAESCRQLVSDWELARIHYFRHQHRTIEHFGMNSKTYKLTEEKWAEIDAQWKKNNDFATQLAAKCSNDAVPITPTEPAPIVAMPALHNEAKFPKLGDQDIVGPMVQVAARIQSPPRRNPGFLKLFNDIKIPTSLFGRPRNRSPTMQ